MTRLLIIDDDRVFCEVLAEGLRALGHETRIAHDAAQALAAAADFMPECVLLDLKMPGGSGLTLIPALLALAPRLRIVVLTGYASIVTAVEAIKLGAVHYLTKPVSSEEIIRAFDKQSGDPAIQVEPRSLNDAAREAIISALERNRHNISAAARELGMHRRTLQRKLDKMR